MFVHNQQHSNFKVLIQNERVNCILNIMERLKGKNQNPSIKFKCIVKMIMTEEQDQSKIFKETQTVYYIINNAI